MSDYISRKAAINAICANAPREATRQSATIEAIFAINDLPAEDVRENTPGEWEMRDGLATCTICGKTPDQSRAIRILEWHYCPMCGAEMRG